nr:TIGR02679 family protein [Knoellia aerolata]
MRAEGRIRVTDLDRRERHAVGDLLGRTVAASQVTVDLAELDERMRLRAGVGIVEAAETVVGRALVDRRARAARLAERRAEPAEAARCWVEDHRDVDWPWLEKWLVAMRSDGVLGREPHPAALVTAALEVLDHRRAFLPQGEAGSSGAREVAAPVARSALAAAVCHDAHALDDDRRLASAVLRAVASATGSVPPTDARDRRELWDRLGVVTDLVSSTCLVWGLAVEVGGKRGGPRPLDTAKPTHVTWWDVKSGMRVSPAGRVLVCENPSVLEAIATAELDVAVICTSGRPNLVTAQVLAHVAESTAPMIYHGDFDWPGLAMATDALRRYGAQPWLMGAEDYQGVPGSLSLKGSPVESPWDPELAAAMRRRDVAVHEEAVLDRILAELRTGWRTAYGKA